MNDKFFNTIAVRANNDYLASIQNTLNHLIGCIVEKIIFIALYGDRYKLVKVITDQEIVQLIEDIRKLPETTKYNLLTIYVNLTHMAEKEKEDLILDISFSTLRNETNSFCEYLKVEFPFMHNTHFLNFNSVKITNEDKEIMTDIFSRILKICLCNSKSHHLGNIENRLYQLVEPTKILLIGETSIKSLEFKEFVKDYVNIEESKLDLSRVLSPLVECLENNYDVFGLKVLDIE